MTLLPFVALIRGPVRKPSSPKIESAGFRNCRGALMVVVGSMNLVWMAAITVVVSAELLVPRGEQLAVATGALFAIGGVAVLLVGYS
ncbi:copper chaperone [Halomicrococcus gelatinilyticus]|uniref:copper chaperone n=1 Tax=Halomicrococcus gelatinilyticus TaxID=1702103 RepID=UPI002E0FA5D9